MRKMKQYTYSQKGKSTQKLCETKTLHFLFLFLWSIFRLSQHSQVTFRYTSEGEAQLKPSQVLMYLQRSLFLKGLCAIWCLVPMPHFDGIRVMYCYSGRFSWICLWWHHPEEVWKERGETRKGEADHPENTHRRSFSQKTRKDHHHKK